MSGVGTNELEARAFVDELIANAGGTTVRIAISDLLRLMPGEVSGPVYQTYAELAADLAWVESAVALVWGDDDELLRGLYRKIDASGAGSWARYADSPISAVAIANAYASAAAAASAADTATQKASDASASALAASNAATTATNKAGEAAASALAANNAAATATTKAGEANASALTASNAASTATTQANTATNAKTAAEAARDQTLAAFDNYNLADLDDIPTALNTLGIKDMAGYNVVDFFKPDVDWTDGTSDAMGIPQPRQIKLAIEALAPPAPLSKIYESALQTMVIGGLITLAHGLGDVPKIISGYIVCQTAESGYSVGAIIDLSTIMVPDTGSSTNNGVGVRYDATNVYVRVGANSKLASFVNGADGSKASLSVANWKIALRAFA
ncbi:MAG: hypothetical protein IE938_19175 [Pseudomonas balearica]|nr:hypothetical protein [Stutzerimonas balearica]